jgi:DNA-binding transcriptional ArsR family regulator
MSETKDDPLRAFIRIPKALVSSKMWRKLSPVARATYVELAYWYNGKNNGLLGGSVRFIAKNIGRSPSTASRALKELVRAGLIEATRESKFPDAGLATQYSLTMYRCDVTERPPKFPFLE